MVIPNNGHIPNNWQKSVHQPHFPLLQYKANLLRVDIEQRTATRAPANNNQHNFTSINGQ